MKILITGCAGLIGASLSHWIIDNTDHQIIGVDNLSGGFESNCPHDLRFKFIKLDINDVYLSNVFTIYKPDIVYHFAAYAAEGRSNYIRSFIHQNNTIGTCNIINACLNHKCKLVFTSSVAVYSGTYIFNEDTVPNPIDEYGLSKWMSERSIQIAGMQGLDWCIVRPRNVYGKYQNIFDVCRNVMGIWMYQIINNESMTIFGSGINKRCFTYVDDILEPLYNARNISNEIINLGSPIPYSIKSANDILSEITGYKKVEHLEERHEVSEAICNTMCSEVLLGYRHKTDLEQGLQKMWEWAKEIQMIERQIPPRLEINIKPHSSIK